MGVLVRYLPFFLYTVIRFTKMIMIMGKELVVDDDYHEQPRLQGFSFRRWEGRKSIITI